MPRWSIFFFILLLATGAYAVDGMRVQLVRVIDGDTIVVNIRQWPDIVGSEIGVRVAGCDTPELRDKRPDMRQLACRARDTVRDVLAQAQVIELHNVRRGKYFRLVADVYADGANLSHLLISSGLARPYDGGAKMW